MTFDFGFAAIDRITGPMKAMERATAGLRGELGRTDRALDTLDRTARGIRLQQAFGRDTPALRRQAQQLGVIREHIAAHRAEALSRGAVVKRAMSDEADAQQAMSDRLGSIASGFVAVGAAAVAAGAAIARVGLSAGRFVVEQTMFQQSTMTSLNAMLRDQGAGAGRAEFRRSLQLAALLPGENNEFVASRRQLSSTFQNSRERDVVFALQEDLANTNPEAATQIRSSLTNVLSQIRGQDRVLGNDLNQLQAAGLGRAKIFDEIARGRGLRGNETSQRRQAAALISSGQVHADEAIRAMVRATERQTGQRIGGFALAQGNSLAGQLSNLESAPATLLQNLDLANLPGIQAFTGALRNINALFDAASPRGQRLIRLMEHLINDVFGELFGQLSGAGGARTLERVFDGMMGAVEGIVGAFRAMWPYLKALGGGLFAGLSAALGPMLRNLQNVSGTGPRPETLRAFERLGQVLGFILGVTVTLVGQVESLLARFEQMGTLGQGISSGLANGITAGLPAPVRAVGTVIQGVVGAATTLLDSHSPSRVFEELGRNTMAGYELGVAGGAPGVAGLLEGAVAPPSPQAGVTRSGDVNITVQVDAQGQDATGIAEAIEAKLRELFGQLQSGTELPA
jgi:hypothetical protein